MTNGELYQNLERELDRSLIIDDATRQYWLDNYQSLPVSALQLFFDQLVDLNNRVDTMILAGLDANPDLAEKFVMKSKDAKRRVFRYLESQQSKEENPDEFLSQNLS